MKIAHDTNGNRILKIEGSDLGTKRGFSIQTLGNLPDTPRNGITAGTDAEVRNYLKAHGTPRQKELYGIK